jgi:hypothetical protein
MRSCCKTQEKKTKIAKKCLNGVRFLSKNKIHDPENMPRMGRPAFNRLCLALRSVHKLATTQHLSRDCKTDAQLRRLHA